MQFAIQKFCFFFVKNLDKMQKKMLSHLFLHFISNYFYFFNFLKKQEAPCGASCINYSFVEFWLAFPFGSVLGSVVFSSFSGSLCKDF